MTFRYQPNAFTPDPLPVSGPTELDDDEYADALANVQTPDIYDVDHTVLDVPGGSVVAWLLFLGQSYPTDTKAGHDEIMQGYYIRGVVRDRLRLRDNFTAIMQGSASNEAAQLALSIRMIPLAPQETRAKVVGWGFAAQ